MVCLFDRRNASDPETVQGSNDSTTSKWIALVLKHVIKITQRFLILRKRFTNIGPRKSKPTFMNGRVASNL